MKIGISKLLIVLFLVSGLTAGIVSYKQTSYGKNHGRVLSQDDGVPIDFFSLQSLDERGNTGFEPWYYYIGNIINSANGNLFLPVVDTILSARGFEIPIVRSYNSYRSDVDNGFGYGWMLNYHTFLTDATDYVLWIDSDGSVHNFSSLGGGEYESPPGIFSRLTKNIDGSFTLWFKEGVAYEFNTNGVLQAIVDNNGNIQTITYDGDNLVRIEDNSGIFVDFSYNADNRISSIEDPLGRQMFYKYDTNGNLLSVTDAMGNATQYTYEDTSHYLLSVVDRVGRELLFEYYTGDLRMIKSMTRQLSVQAVLGDVNADNTIDIVDALLVAQYFVGLNPGGFDVRAADVDASSGVDIVDALLIAQYFVGLIDQFPGEQTTPDPTQLPNSQPTSAPTPIPDPFKVFSITYDGLWTNYTDAGGYVTSVKHNECGNPIDIIDPLDYTVTYEWDANMNMVSYSNENGNVWTYSYDEYGNRINATDPSGYFTLYEWGTIDLPDQYISLLKNETNPLGYRTQYIYDSNENHIELIDATGNSSFKGYDEFGQLTSYTNPRGYTTTLSYDDHGNLVNITDARGNGTLYVYDLGGRQTSMTDANGYTTAFTYNGINRLTKAVDALGNETFYYYNEEGETTGLKNANGHETSYQRNILSERETETDPIGYVTYYQYDRLARQTRTTDAKGQQTNFIYDAKGRLLSVTDAIGNIESYTYDGVGNRLSVENKRGDITHYEYDPLNRLIHTSNPTGHYETYSYDPVGNRISSTDKNGHTTTYEYDPLNRLIKETDPLDHYETYSHDPVGNRISSIDKNGNPTYYHYDELDRLIKIVDGCCKETLFGYDAVGNRISKTNASGYTTTYFYDPLRRMVSITDALGTSSYRGYDPVGNLIRSIDANGNTDTYAYDELNRLEQITDPLGYNTFLLHDELGNIVSKTDAGGYVTTYEYDSLNRLIKETDALGYETIYNYDEEGNRINFTDANGNTSAYEYDQLNRLSRVTSPMGYEWEYHWDPVGNKDHRIDANGDTTYYHHDAADRRTAISYPDGTNYTIQYDPVGNPIRFVHNGGIGDITDKTYDEYDRVTAITVDYGGLFTKTISYTYDDVGNLITKQDPDSTTTYTYDPLNRLATLFNPVTGPGPMVYTYDAGGRIIREECPHGIYQEYQYDGMDRVTHVETQDPMDNPYEIFDYEYDPMGNIIKKTYMNGNYFTYEYDPFNRPVGYEIHPSGYTANYTWDGINRLSKILNGAPYTYSYDQDNRLFQSVDPMGWAADLYYDDNGNLIHEDRHATGEAIDYQYDYENKLTDINYLPVGNYIHYDYSAEGQKLKEDNFGLITYYLYGSPDVIAEMDEFGMTTSYFSPDISVTNYHSGTSSCIHDDGQEGTTFFTDEFGGFVAQLDFDLFGEAEGWGNIESVENAISWQGRQYDFSATNLYQDNERYFFPDNGVYYTRCPNIYPGLNTYTLDTMTAWQSNLNFWTETNSISYGIETGIYYSVWDWIFCTDKCEEGETRDCKATEVIMTLPENTPEDTKTTKAAAKVLGWTPKMTPGMGKVLVAYANVILNSSMKNCGCWIWVKVEWEECEEENCWAAWKELDWQDKEAWHRCKVGGQKLLRTPDIHEFPPSAKEVQKCKDEAEEKACPD